MNILAQLNEIIETAERAAAELKDEHEGNFTRCVNELKELTTELHDLVQKW